MCLKPPQGFSCYYTTSSQYHTSRHQKIAQYRQKQSRDAFCCTSLIGMHPLSHGLSSAEQKVADDKSPGPLTEGLAAGTGELLHGSIADLLRSEPSHFPWANFISLCISPCLSSSRLQTQPVQPAGTSHLTRTDTAIYICFVAVQ